MSKPEKPFIALNIAILTVSDTRSLEEDTSGKYLADSLVESGHTLAERAIRTDDIYQIRAIVSQWIADPEIHAIITTGGTGFYIRDQIPEALSPLFDKEVQGFGEMFRALSRDEIGMSTLQSRALAGMANNTVIFCIAFACLGVVRRSKRFSFTLSWGKSSTLTGLLIEGIAVFQHNQTR
jgi:molybdopterin adenylyltransferase